MPNGRGRAGLLAHLVQSRAAQGIEEMGGGAPVIAGTPGPSARRPTARGPSMITPEQGPDSDATVRIGRLSQATGLAFLCSVTFEAKRSCNESPAAKYL